MNLLLPWCGIGLIFGVYKLFPESFTALFLLNIWLLSLPHTFATFTRKDRRTKKEMTLTLGLLAVFFMSVIGFASVAGLVALNSLYFYWQQFHYGKQNYGLAVLKSEGKRSKADQLFYLAIVLMALIGLHANGVQSFFGYVLYAPFRIEVSVLAVFIVMALTTFCFCLLRPQQSKDAVGHTLIFSFAYLYCEHFAVGWLLLNVFHNLQYLTLMTGHEERLSFLILPACLTVVVYGMQYFGLSGLILFTIPLGLGLMMTLNFTHYTLDGLIWKRKT